MLDSVGQGGVGTSVGPAGQRDSVIQLLHAGVLMVQIDTDPIRDRHNLANLEPASHSGGCVTVIGLLLAGDDPLQPTHQVTLKTIGVSLVSLG